jgi:hypothetical protein
MYAVGLILYLLSWAVVGPGGIDQRLAWVSLHHAFADIADLEMVPAGARSASMSKEGPWYCVTLRSGRYISLSLENEGMTAEELKAVAAFIAEKSGLEWRRRRDAKAR